jgi:hypothetical protein
MDNPSVLDVRAGLLRWIIGGLAGVSLAAVVMLATYVYLVEVEAAQFVLIAVLMTGLTAFVYKTEVDRQEAEIVGDETVARPPTDKIKSPSLDVEALVTAILDAERSRDRI